MGFGGPPRQCMICFVSADVTDVIKSSTYIKSYPNPFNPSTTIEFYIAHDENVKLSVYNLRGQKIYILVNNYLNAGNHTVVWNGIDSYDNPVSSGIYFLFLEAGTFTDTLKIMLIK